MTAFTALHLSDRLPLTVTQTAARVRSVARRLLDRPELPVLDEVHPAAATGTRLDLGVQAIAIDEIRGTAVGGPKLRGADFKPVDELRSGAWMDRYRRLLTAFERMVTLPPIEVLEVGGEYWVVDGHNRVAIARELRLAFLDANVTGIRWAGGPALRSQVASLGAVLEASAQQRAAVSDRWQATSVVAITQRGGWRPCLTGCAG